MITIVDFKMGNIGSIVNMLKKIGVECSLAREPRDVLNAQSLILPGVGAFAHGMRNLRESGFDEALNEAVLGRGIPVLGICLGMQLFARRSEESGSVDTAGLGWIDANVVRFCLEESQFRVPHMGWNEVQPRSRSELFRGFSADARFYFVHSYHVVCDDENNIAAIANYGGQFAAAVEKENIYGVQFHPEKSHRFGMQLLQRFAQLTICSSRE